MRKSVIFKRSVLTLILAAVMILSATVVAGAANTATVGGTTYTDINAAVDAAIAQEKVITLTSDSSIYLEPYETVVIDKAGYSLTVTTKNGWETVVLENTDGTVTAASYKDLGEKFAAMRLELDGSITMKFFVTNATVLENNAEAYIEVKIPDRNKNVKVSKYYAKDLSKDASGRYVLTIKDVAAAQQTEKISFQVVNGEERGKLRQYSVMDYANIVVKTPEKLNVTEDKRNKTVALVKAMLNYGAKAQVLHSYNSNALANTGLYDESDNPVDEITSTVIGSLGTNSSSFGLQSGANKAKSTLNVNLESAVSMRFFIASSNNKVYKETMTATLTVGDESEDIVLTPVKSGETVTGWEFVIENIPAQNYDKTYEIVCYTTTATNTQAAYRVTWSANVLGYANSMIDSTTATEAQKEAAAALYNYYIGMKNFLGAPVHTECAHGATHIEITKAATCTTAGEQITKCTLCGVATSETVAINALGHSTVARAAVAAGCETQGMAAHYECVNCGCFFTDAAATLATTADELKIAATGHNEGVNGLWDAAAGRYMSATACASCGKTYPVMGNLNRPAAALNAMNGTTAMNDAKMVLSEDGSYVTLGYDSTIDTNNDKDIFILPSGYTTSGKTEVTGQYIIIKYRTTDDFDVQLFSSSNKDFQANSGNQINCDIENDGKWHYIILNFNERLGDTIFGTENGTYSANFLRLDIATVDGTLDIGYIVMADNLASLIASVKTFDVDARELVADNIGDECVHPDYAQGYKLIDGYSHVPFCSLCGYVADDAVSYGHTVSVNVGEWNESLGYIESNDACPECNGRYAVDYVYVVDADTLASNYTASYPAAHAITSNGTYATLKSNLVPGSWQWISLNPTNWLNNKQYVEYAVIKYRAPIAAAGDSFALTGYSNVEASFAHPITLKCDGAWHYAVVDLTAYPSNWVAVNGLHSFDKFGLVVTNYDGKGSGLKSGESIDIEFIAFGAGDDYIQSVINAKSESCTHAHVLSNECVGCGEDRTPNANQQMIDNANALAGGIQTYFTNGFRNEVVLQNQNMSLDYPLSATASQYPVYLNNAAGKSYIAKTFDVFVEMDNGDKVYASNSFKTATMNSFRFGYYYYETRIEGQNFSDTLTGTSYKVSSVGLAASNTHNMSVPTSGSKLGLKVTGISDPYAQLKNTAINYNSTTGDYEYQYARFTIACSPAASSTDKSRTATIYAYSDGSDFAYNTFTFDLITDGAAHDYVICFKDNWRLEGNIQYLRFDINAPAVDDYYEIREIELVNGTGNGAPDLYLARNFHIYPDKLHHEVQISAYKDVSGIASVGVEVKIPKSTVAKLAVADANGQREATTLSALNVDWATAEYVAFDITDVGVFGYILPYNELGTLSVTDDGTNYVLVQKQTPENGTILAGDGYDKNTTQIDRGGTVEIGNKNDFYMGQRIYTDATHTFTAFLKEAEIERNPLPESAFTVNAEYSDNSKYLGYDPLRGSYEFVMKGSGFNEAFYYYPNRQMKLNFTVNSSDKRNIYILASTASGGLESSVVLDKNLMLLPIPVEVSKNFGTDGDNTIFDRLDSGYGEAVFPILTTAGEPMEYNVLHLYQNWGKNPLKQGSSIEYKAPYYHLSTGTTETNCIVPFGWTTDWAISNMLPDHRTMSQEFWPDQPQHAASGIHSFLGYTDSEGKYRETAIKSQYLDSYGPTYFDVQMNYISTDNKVKVTFTNMEMPQTDENRAYYTMTFEFLDTVTVPNFANNFQFYSVTDRPGNGYYYTKLGYLDANNTSKVKEYNSVNSVDEIIPLGTNYPYFDMFKLNTIPDGKDGTGNVSFIIGDYDMKIGGVSNPYTFAIRKQGDAARLTLNTTGTVTFKAGDYITFEAIIMPWGSQDSDFSLNDQNVRDVRTNSFVNRVKAHAGANAVVMDNDEFLPEIMSTNGKSAEFTITGGGLSSYANQTLIKDAAYGAKQNMVVRVYGFDTLTVPTIYEWDGSKWVEYKVSSINSPDRFGYGEYYDGYSMFKDADGTYSYAFVVDMSNGTARKFKVEANTEFESWPRNEIDDGYDFNLLTMYYDSVDIAALLRAGAASGSYSGLENIIENGVTYTRIKPGTTDSDPYITLTNRGTQISGQYMVFKYRTNAENNTIGFLASTVREYAANAADTFAINNQMYIADGEWHVAVIDLASILPASFTVNENGDYILKTLRADFFNTTSLDPAKHYLDIAYIGFAEELSTAVMLDKSVDEILVYMDDVDDAGYSKGKGREALYFYDPTTGAEKEGTYKVPFYYVHMQKANGVEVNKSQINTYLKNTTAQIDPGTYEINVNGWIVTQKGISRYVAYVEAEDGTSEWIELGKGTDRSDVLSAVIQASYPEYEVWGAKEGTGFNFDIKLDAEKYHGKTVELTLYAVTYATNDLSDNSKDVEGGYLPLYKFTDVVPDHFGPVGTDNGDGTHTITCVAEGCNATIKGNHNYSHAGGFINGSYYATCTICNSPEYQQILQYTVDENYETYGVCSGWQAGYGITANGSYITIADSSCDGAWGGISFGAKLPGEVGPYFVIKYRVPSGAVLNGDTNIVIHPRFNGSLNTRITLNTDGAWHTEIINWTENVGATDADGDGLYTLSDFWMMWYEEANLASLEIDYMGFGDTTANIGESLGTNDSSFSCDHSAGFTTAISTTATTHTFICSTCGLEATVEHTLTTYQGKWSETAGSYVTYCEVCDALSNNKIGLNVFLDASILASPLGGKGTCTLELSSDGTYTSYTNTGSDANFVPYTNGGTRVSGQYLVVKYRGVSADGVGLSIYTSSNNSTKPTGGHNSSTTLLGGDNWHYLILDLTTKFGDSIFGMENGEYSANYLRFTFGASGETVDIAYAGFGDSLEHICASLKLNDANVTTDCDHPDNCAGNTQYVDATSHGKTCKICGTTMTENHVASAVQATKAEDGKYYAVCTVCKGLTNVEKSFNINLDANYLYSNAKHNHGGKSTGTDTDGTAYVRFNNSGEWWGGAVYGRLDFIGAGAPAGVAIDGFNSGKYLVMKVRNAGETDAVFGYIATTGTSVTGGGMISSSTKVTLSHTDWKVYVFDLSKYTSYYVASGDNYKVTELVLHTAKGSVIDVAYVGITDSLDVVKPLVTTETCSHGITVDGVSATNHKVHGSTCAICSKVLSETYHTFSSIYSTDNGSAYTQTCSGCGYTIQVPGNVFATQAQLYAGKASQVSASINKTNGITTFTTSGTDPYIIMYANSSVGETGQYFYIKYRTTNVSFIQTFTSTKSVDTGGGFYNPTINTVTDGEWHYMVFDLSAANNAQFPTADLYKALYLRLDLGNTSGATIDIEYAGLANSLDKLGAGLQAYDSADIAAHCDHTSVALEDVAYVDDVYHGQKCKLCGTTLTIPHCAGADVHPTYNSTTERYETTCSICNTTVPAAGSFVYNNSLSNAGVWEAATGNLSMASNQYDSTSPAFFIAGHSNASGTWTAISLMSKWSTKGTGQSPICGKYMVVKYRSDYSGTLPIEVGTSAGGGRAAASISVTGDGQWHLAVVDLSSNTKWVADDNGDYILGALWINWSHVDASSFPEIDIEYIAFSDVNPLAQ